MNKYLLNLKAHAIPDTTMGSGDVKYHMGFRGEHTTKDGKKVNLQFVLTLRTLKLLTRLLLDLQEVKPMLFTTVIMIKYFLY